MTDPLGSAELVHTERQRHIDYARAWLAGYRSPKTRENYATGITQWFEFLERFGVDPLKVARPHVDLWLRELEVTGRAPRTVASRFTAVRSFYRYLHEEELWLGRLPTAGVKGPKIPRKSPTGYLDRGQLADLVRASRAFGPNAHALVCILVFNGLRIGEVCSLDVESLSMRSNYPVMTFIRKGGDWGTAVLGRTTEIAVRAAIGERTSGPLLLTQIGTRMNQQAAQRVLGRCAPAIENCPARIHPHMLRHSWTTMAIADGVPMDQLVHDGGWVDSRMPMAVYAHGQENPLRAASHRVESLVLSL
jgi:site-specific recombinase XerC